jgi:hypothetical protein
MMRRCVWLLLLALAACGSFGTAGDSPEAVCRRQAYDDPTVKRLGIENLGASAPDPGLDFDYNLAMRKATDTCLRQKGITVRGGVEPVRPQ